eukprot:scaffold7714_cov133-Isochrysis_galbana.AAC.2
MHTFISKKGRRAAHNVVSARIMDAATGSLMAPEPLLVEAIGAPPAVPNLSREEEEVLRRFHALNEVVRDITSSRWGRTS